MTSPSEGKPLPHVAQRAALYLRVSTARQAEHDVSIPDQKRQGEAYCEARGLQLVETFVEPGASATNDRRPEFQRMIEAGTSKPAPFDVVVVHSFSRFFRDHFELEFYIRKLAKNGVKLVSITQEMGDDPMHVMMRQIMALFDEYQSKENAKHVIRALKENARQGFWNGSLPPIGYRTVAAEQRGAKVKKKIEIDPLHADTVRLIYRLALEGDGTTGQMGVKNIVSYLNSRRIFTRDGGRWGIGQVHRILTRRTYMGEHEFNKRTKTKELKPVSEIVIVPVPPIIDPETFDAVQKLLKARNPKVMPSRVISGPTMLTGLIHCAKCGGAMTIRTGKGGRYRYYACSMKARQGPTACEGMAVPMEKLDDLVADHLEKQLLQPERLETVLAAALDRREEHAERRREHIAELNKRSTESESRLKRLYDAIEAGVADLDDPALKDRIDGLKAIRDQAKADADRAQALAGLVAVEIDVAQHDLVDLGRQGLHLRGREPQRGGGDHGLGLVETLGGDERLVDVAHQLLMAAGEELAHDELGRGLARGRLHRLRVREGDAALGALPPALPPRAAVADLADEIVLREGAQVIAGRAGGLPRHRRQGARRLGAVLVEDVVDLDAERVRERAQGAGIEPALLLARVRDGRGRVVCGHGAKIALQRMLCK